MPHVKNTVVLTILIFRHIQCLHLMYGEVAWILVSSETQVQLQVIRDPDYLPDYLSVCYDYGITKYICQKKPLTFRRETITVMSSVGSNKTASLPNLEFVFKGVGQRLKLTVPNNVSIQWAPKGSYRLEHNLKFIEKVPAQPCSLFPGKRKIFTLDDYSAHLHPEVKEALKKKDYFLVILPGRITGDLQVNGTDVHHPLKSSYQEKESLLMIEKLQENPDKIHCQTEMK